MNTRDILISEQQKNYKVLEEIMSDKSANDSDVFIISNRLSRITKALQKIECNSYGKCDKCGREISEERLNAFPDITTCISCATKYGNKKVRYAGTEFSVGL